MSDFYFSVVKGDTVHLRAPIVREGNPVDLTGLVDEALTFIAELAVPDAAAPVQTIEKQLGDGITLEGDATDGVAIVTISPQDTDPIITKTTYRCRLHLTEANGTETTVGSGDIAFAP